jgi:hypothetical protein
MVHRLRMDRAPMLRMASVASLMRTGRLPAGSEADGAHAESATEATTHRAADRGPASLIGEACAADRPTAH